MRGLEHEWFTSYMSNRKQYIQIGKTRSDHTVVDYGVPQGSVLGTTLFLLFIDSLKLLNTSGTKYMYADDIAMIYSGSSDEGMQTEMNNDLNLIRLWMLRHKMTLNVDKTHYMFFSNTIPMQMYVHYENMEIQRVNEFKYLGLTLDSKLSFSSHIRTLKSKASSSAGLFYRMRNRVPVNVRHSIYYALFHSHIIYGIETYSSTNLTKIAEIQVLQNKAIRNLFDNEKGTSNYNLHLKNNILPVRYIIKMKHVIQIHNMLHNNIKSNTFLVKNSDSHKHNTRIANNIKMDKTQTSRYGKTSALHLAKSEYNKLPESYKILSKNQFKYAIKKYYFDVFKVSKIV